MKRSDKTVNDEEKRYVVYVVEAIFRPLDKKKCPALRLSFEATYGFANFDYPIWKGIYLFFFLALLV